MEGAEDGDGTARECEEDNCGEAAQVDGGAHAEDRDVQASEQPDDAGDGDQGLFLDAESTHYLLSFSSAGSSYRETSRRANRVSHSPPSMREAKMLRST